MEPCDVQFVKVFSIVVQFIGVRIYSIKMCQNTPEETIIVVEVLDIKDSLFAKGLGCLNVTPVR